MPPKKLKPDEGQISLFNFLKNDQTDKPTDQANDHHSDLPGTLSETNEKSLSLKLSEKGFWQRWTKIWPWLYEKNDKMYCKVCIKHGKSNSFTSGNTNFRTSTLSRHAKTDDHMYAEKSPSLAQNLKEAMQNVNSKEDEAVIKMIKTVVWLAKENLPLSKFNSLVDHMISIDVPCLEALGCSSKAKLNYQSYYSATEMLSAVCDYLDSIIDKKLQDSPCVSVLADESTDIANKKRMTLNAVVIDKNTSCADTIFLRNVEYEEGTGVGLASVIVNEMTKRNVPFQKILGFGSDGASVMTGSDKGVKGILMRKQPHMIHVHCLAHRLALCTSQAAESINSISEYQRFLTNLFYYFKASPTREQELHKVQAVLNHPVLKYKEIHAVRWLSCFEAVDSLFRTLDPLLSYLHQRVSAKDPKSKGLLKKLATTDFIFITYMMMDVLPTVMKLCLKFQEKSLDIGQAKVALSACLTDLQALRDDKLPFTTYMKQYSEDVTLENGRYEFKGHIVTKSLTNQDQLKCKFIDNLLANLEKRFPQKQLLDAFFVLSMRTINFESDPLFGDEEIEVLLCHFAEEKTFGDTTSPALLVKDHVRKEWRLVKEIVKGLRYPVDSFKSLWRLITENHAEEVPNMIKLAQYAAVLPLHTADCERVFSQQNKIITKHRCNLSSENLDRLLKVRLSADDLDFNTILGIWRTKKIRRRFQQD